MYYDNRMRLLNLDREELIKGKTQWEGEFLAPKELKPNVLGMGVGIKWVNGIPTGEPALIVMVSHKVGKEQLMKGERIPKAYQGIKTDVLDIGEIEIQKLVKSIRPVIGGYSVGHPDVTAGTVGVCCVSDESGEDSSSKYYILSNNHVLANSNQGEEGDPIYQPGPIDGGGEQDSVAKLTRYIPIALDPPTPREEHQNRVDAAIAEGDLADLERGIYWIGRPRGYRQLAELEVGTLLHKTGRTSGYNKGRITALDATIDVSFGQGRVARFKEQIVTTPISAGGDSGSLVLTLDNIALGLLFAGSNKATILNPIEYVQQQLAIEVASTAL